MLKINLLKPAETFIDCGHELRGCPTLKQTPYLLVWLDLRIRRTALAESYYSLMKVKPVTYLRNN